MSNIAELYRTVEVNMAWWFYGVNARGDNPGDERLAPGGRSYFNDWDRLTCQGSREGYAMLIARSRS